MPTQRHAWVTGLALLALAGCTTEAETQQPSPPPEPTVRVMQYRPDEVNRVLVVKVGNPADSGLVQVEGLEVVVPGFEGVGTVDITANIAPGRQFDLRIPYGEPVCAADQPSGDVVVRLGVPGSDEPREIVSPPGSELLSRIREEECSIQGILDATPLRWSATWDRAGAGKNLVVTGELVIGPVAEGRRVEFTGLEGSVLFNARVAGPIELAPGESRNVAVRITPQRCDPHAMADNSKGFEFRARVRLRDPAAAGQPEVLVPVLPDGAGKNVLADAWLERCGFDAAS